MQTKKFLNQNPVEKKVEEEEEPVEEDEFIDEELPVAAKSFDKEPKEPVNCKYFREPEPIFIKVNNVEGIWKSLPACMRAKDTVLVCSKENQDKCDLFE